MRPPQLKPAAELAAGKPHGTRIKYIGGCRCSDCRAANALYEKTRAFLASSGRGNALVPAAAAREHLLKLSLRRIGRRTIEQLAGVSHSVLQMIKAGKRRQIRAQTAQKILSVKGNYGRRIHPKKQAAPDVRQHQAGL